MKVMDKSSLATRKKLPRAQTEREILQSLDQPFLPTLYTHFETDKFSCLAMGYCLDGHLHTLRQRPPGKHFSEQAVRINTEYYGCNMLLRRRMWGDKISLPASQSLKKNGHLFTN